MQPLFTKHRLDGIDLARSLALLGMIVVNFRIAFEAELTEGSFLYYFFSFVEGKAAALFIFLAGIGISLGIKNKIEPEAIKKYKITLLKKSLTLFVIGILYYPIWPADILHFYSFYILCGILFLGARSEIIAIASIGFLLVSLILILIFDYTAGWNFETMDYIDFWTIPGFIRHIFFNGFHPVFPWSVFLLLGLMFGRIELNNKSLRRKILLLAVTGFVFSFTITSLVKAVAVSSGYWTDFLEIIFSSSPMPPTIFYVLTAGFFAVSLSILSIEISELHIWNKILSPFFTTGKFALTHYVFHVFIGMTLIETFIPAESRTVENLFVIGLLYFSCSIMFSIIWKTYWGTGPLEKLFRKLTN